MINSLWPLPIGINESIAFKPVCIGSWTDCLGIMPGAFVSTLALLTFFNAPLPSIGFPKASTTLPSNPFPAGTSTIEPVLFTVSPSFMSLSLPKITIPTLSFSRFKAIPAMPPSNSTISPALISSNPWTLAIPSPTDKTLPISVTSASVPKFLIWSFNIEEISAALISI